MELTLAKCEQILNTLPIGYYTGRRIEMSMDTTVETSFYSPMEDKIVVSYHIIAERMAKMPDNADTEEAVRSMLYHEVSHAILTPTCLPPSTPVNIFEDERIESVLRNYYHNVNFKKQLYDLHGGHAPKAVDTETAFYNAVRFGLGTDAVKQRVHEIKNKYATLNRASDYYEDDVYDYRNEINALYRMVEEEYGKDPDAFEESGSNEEQKQLDNLKSNDSGSDSKNGNSQQGDSENGANEDTKNTDVTDESIESKISPEEMKRMVGACLGKKPNLSDAETQKLNEFQKTVETIIGNFNKKNSGGSGYNTYSGVFNPRAVARKDYRFFERSMSTQGNNRFGTCHLNLIIDCSGSFAYNVPLTNGILQVLTEVERKNRNFSMDVVFINHEIHKCKTIRERQMNAWGGNKIPSNMKQILLDLQKPQTCNYNIILFDGDAMCNNFDCSGIRERCKLFEVFDMKQTTMISDPDNKQYMTNFTSAKKVITKNYTSELINHITHALTIAFG